MINRTTVEMHGCAIEIDYANWNIIKITEFCEYGIIQIKETNTPDDSGYRFIPILHGRVINVFARTFEEAMLILIDQKCNGNATNSKMWEAAYKTLCFPLYVNN